MQRFAELVVRFRGQVIVATILLTVLFAALLPRLRLDSDILNYLPDNDPAVRLFDAVGIQFGGNSLAIVGVEADDVFAAHTIGTIHELTERIREIPEVSHVTSLTDVLDVRAGEWGLEIGRLVDKHHLPTEPDELARLRTYTLGKDLYAGRVVSEDGTAALIIARIRADANRTVVAGKIAAAAREIGPAESIYYAGTPFQMLEIQRMVVRDLCYLLPLVSLLLVLVLAASFRTSRGVILPLAVVALSTIWTLGAMALLRIPLTIISNITPIVLIAIGSAYGIHLMSRFTEEPIGPAGPRVRVYNTVSGVGFPIVLAGITTLIGFLSFTGSYLTIVKYFGLCTALGVLFATLLAVTFIPAVLSFRQRRSQRDTPLSQHRSAELVTRAVAALGAFVLRRERWILGAAVIVAALCLLALPRLNRDVDMLKYFPPKSSLRMAERLMEEKFGGSIPIQVSVHGDLGDPMVLKEVWKLEKFLETVPAVHKPKSIADLIAEMNYVMNGRYSIPETRKEVSNLWFFLEGEETLEQLVSGDRSWGLIQASMASVNTATIREIVNLLNGYIAEHLETSLVAVSLETSSGATGTSASIEQLERIATLVRWDIAGRAGATAPTTERIAEILRPYQNGREFALTHSERAELEDRITRFYSEDLAQAAVRSTQSVAMALSGLATEAAPVEEKVAVALRGLLDPDQDAPDSLAVADDAAALQALVQEARGDFRADRALCDIQTLFPEQLRGDPELQRRLRGDLWELNHRSALIAATVSDLRDEVPRTVHLAVEQAGIPLIYKHLDENLVKTQIISLLFTIALVFAILAIQFRSLVAGVFGAIPMGLTVLINFGVMSLLGVALDIATVLVGSIAIAIGIDYTIHFLSRFRAEARNHDSPRLILDATLRTTGKAILINASTVTLGFLVLIFASVVPIRNFGWLTALTMVSSAAGSLCVLPALILVLRPRFVGTLITNNYSADLSTVRPPMQKEA
jgi:hydrophobe/amphiphile efflux-3 (HAE3) family protein